MRYAAQPTGTLEQLSQKVEQLADSARIVAEYMPKVLAALVSPQAHLPKILAELASLQAAQRAPQPTPTPRASTLSVLRAGLDGEQNEERMAYKLGELAKAAGVSTCYLRDQIKAGKLRARRASRLVLISAADAATWYDSLPLCTVDDEAITNDGQEGENAGNA